MNKIKQAKKERNLKDKEWRLSALDKANYQCERCGKKTNLNVHHILSRRLYPIYRHELWNAIVLDAGCHKFCRGSPHQDSVGFVSWLMVKDKSFVDFLIEKIYQAEQK